MMRSFLRLIFCGACLLVAAPYGGAQEFVFQNDPARAPLITPAPAGAEEAMPDPPQGMRVELLTPPVPRSGGAGGLIDSPSFEPAGATPPEQFWRREAWRLDDVSSEFRFLRGEDLPADSALRGLRAMDGEYFAYIRNRENNDARWVGMVALEPGAYYRLSGFVAAAVPGEGTAGATLGMFNGVTGQPLRDTGGQWVAQEVYFRAGANQRTGDVALRLGFFGGDVKGEAAFDNVRLMQVQPDEIPPGVAIFQSPDEAAPPVVARAVRVDEESRSATPFALLVGVGAFVVAAAATLVLLLWLDGADDRRQDERAEKNLK